MGSPSYIWYLYMYINVNINALRCNNCNIEKVDIDKLVRVMYINRCTYDDLCCVTCQPGYIGRCILVYRYGFCIRLCILVFT